MAMRRISIAYDNYNSMSNAEQNNESEEDWGPHKPQNTPPDSSSSSSKVHMPATQHVVQEPDHAPPDYHSEHHSRSTEEWWQGKLLKVLRHEQDGYSMMLKDLTHELSKFASRHTEALDMDTVLDLLLSDTKRFEVGYDLQHHSAVIKALPSRSWSPSWAPSSAKRTKLNSGAWTSGSWTWVPDPEEEASSDWPSWVSTWRSPNKYFQEQKPDR